jgi:hypothetical protein
VAGLKSIPTMGDATPTSPARSRPKAPPPSKTQGRPLPDLERMPLRPRGPAFLHLGAKRPSGTGGPGVMPVDFPGSGAEWVWFWASRKYYWSVDHLDPRAAPYDGGLFSGWLFQSPENPANPRAAGTTIADFVYPVGGMTYTVRIEGFFWHIGKGAAQQARDAYLIHQSQNGMNDVIRVNDTDFMEDVTGATAISLLADILAGRSLTGALQGGTARAPRYADFAAGIMGG